MLGSVLAVLYASLTSPTPSAATSTTVRSSPVIRETSGATAGAGRALPLLELSLGLVGRSRNRRQHRDELGELLLRVRHEAPPRGRRRYGWQWHPAPGRLLDRKR